MYVTNINFIFYFYSGSQLKFALSIRGDFALGHFSNVRTIQILANLGDVLSALSITWWTRVFGGPRTECYGLDLKCILKISCVWKVTISWGWYTYHQCYTHHRIHQWIHPLLSSEANCTVRRWTLVEGGHWTCDLGGCILVSCISLLSLLSGFKYVCFVNGYVDLIIICITLKLYCLKLFLESFLLVYI